MDEKPWKWDELKLTITTVGEGDKVFTLAPCDPKKIGIFYQPLEKAREISAVLMKAKRAFESGAAEYTGATRRLEKLLDECLKADRAEFEAARQIEKFFTPAGFGDEFVLENLDALNAIANEAIQRLAEAAAQRKKEEPPKTETANGKPKKPETEAPPAAA